MKEKMNIFWSDAFFDMDECLNTREEFTKDVGREIKNDLDEIKFAIQDMEPKKAIELIKEMQRKYNA